MGGWNGTAAEEEGLGVAVHFTLLQLGQVGFEFVGSIGEELVSKGLGANGLA